MQKTVAVGMSCDGGNEPCHPPHADLEKWEHIYSTLPPRELVSLADVQSSLLAVLLVLFSSLSGVQPASQLKHKHLTQRSTKLNQQLCH